MNERLDTSVGPTATFTYPPAALPWDAHVAKTVTSAEHHYGSEVGA
jgi:hypothetical protein